MGCEAMVKTERWSQVCIKLELISSDRTEVAMLDAYIIEEIKRRDEDRRRREEERRPRLELPLPIYPPDEDQRPSKPDDGSDRGVVIIDYS
jgi:hypothetical protein